MKKINELFYSLQGEGYWTGTPAVFIRFSGCNLHCPFCDTRHEEGEMMSDEKIMENLRQYPTRHVILTGGEPSLFIDYDFVALLQKAGYYVHIETNGTQILPENIDWVTYSPKENGILTHANELKIVYEGQDLSPWETFDTPHFFLQPCSGKNTQETIAYLLQHPQWRLSLQTHKLLNLR